MQGRLDITSLNKDTFLVLSYYLGAKDICRMAQVSKQFQRVAAGMLVVVNFMNACITYNDMSECLSIV